MGKFGRPVARLLVVLAALSVALWPSVAAADPVPILTSMRGPATVRPGEEFEIVVRAVNRGDAAIQGSISVSFPDAPTVRVVSSSPFNASSSYARVFQPGENVYHFKLNRTVPAQHILAELFFDEAWPKDQERFLTLRVVAPREQAKLQIFARATMRAQDKRLVSFPVTAPREDQQGFPVVIAEVQVAQSTATPTALPSPSPTALPTTTHTPISQIVLAASPTPASSQPPVVAAVPTTPPPTIAPTATQLAPTATPVVSAPPAPSPAPQSDASSTVFLGVLIGAALIGGAAVAGIALMLVRRPTSASNIPPPAAAPASGLPPSPSPPPSGWQTPTFMPTGSPPPASTPTASPMPWPTPSPSPAPFSGPSPADPLGASPAPPTLPAWTPANAAAGMANVPFAYQIVGPPKQGGMAAVYKAYQPTLDRYVAIKVMSPALASDPVFVQRFYEEARRTAKLDHPNIVTIHDMGQLPNGSLYITMRFIEGHSLQELLGQERLLDVARASRIAAQVAEALEFAHQRGVIHRDVKPSNIMVEPGDRVTLTDFGIAKLVGDTQLTRPGAVVGTPKYLSPEQAQGEASDHRSDLYALGVVLYEALTGQPPFVADNPTALLYAHVSVLPRPPRQLNPSIPPTVEAVVLRALAKDRAQRYQSGREFVEALWQAIRDARP